MSLWTLQDIARAIGADKNIGGEVSGVSIDTRTLAPGDLFVALVGETDGAKFVDDALAKGAAAAIASDNYTGNSDKVFVVKDPLEALGKLGAAARARMNGKVIAVTGSVGKTSTKEMLAHVFAAAGRTHATQGNLNNHFGLPLTLARMPADTEYAVLEMGMNHANEITPLSTLARPDIAMITTVDAVHLEYFESVEHIADAKAEIFTGLPEKTGVAILNRDNPHYLRLLGHAHAGQLKVLSFGQAPECDAQLLDMKLSARDTTVRANIHGMEIEYVIGAPGAHWVPNSLAVLLAVSAAGANVSAAAGALKTITPPSGRGARRTITLPGHRTITVLDESYNASPVSVAAALATLGQMPGRRIAALGDMKELGPRAAELHRGLAGHVVENNIDLLFCCGEMMQELFIQTPPALRGEWARDSQLLATALLEHLLDGDVLLVKGSHSMKMDVILSVLDHAVEAA
jgi:UDP-N-acetylmuramoyl-tripeptide--D-alanyl-D-alanine ligase